MYRNYIRLTPLQIVGHPCASDEEHHEAEECAEDSGVDEDVRIRLTFVIGHLADSLQHRQPLAPYLLKSARIYSLRRSAGLFLDSRIPSCMLPAC